MIGVDPLSTPEAYEVATIGGVPTPGVIARGGVTGFKRDTDIDVQKGKGSTGASTTIQGDPPAEGGTITVTLWRNGEVEGDPNDFADADAFRDMLEGAKRKKLALDIQHPDINDLGIVSVLVKSIGQREDAGKGRSTVTYAFTEYRKAKPAGGTPTKSADKDSSRGGLGMVGALTMEHVDPMASALERERQLFDKLFAQASELP